VTLVAERAAPEEEDPMPRITVEQVELITGPAYRVTRGRKVWIRETLEQLLALRLPLDRIRLR
jgi:hypothetical protein